MWYQNILVKIMNMLNISKGITEAVYLWKKKIPNEHKYVLHQHYFMESYPSH